MKAGFSLEKFIVVERDIPLGLGHKLDRGTGEPSGSVPQWAGVKMVVVLSTLLRVLSWSVKAI